MPLIQGMFEYWPQKYIHSGLTDLEFAKVKIALVWAKTASRRCECKPASLMPRGRGGYRHRAASCSWVVWGARTLPRRNYVAKNFLIKLWWFLWRNIFF